MFCYVMQYCVYQAMLCYAMPYGPCVAHSPLKPLQNTSSFILLSHPPTLLFQRLLLPPVVVFFLGMCAGVRMICVRGERSSGGLYAPVFLNGDKSSTPALDDFSTHQSEVPDRLLGRYRDRDNSVEDEREVILESDLHEIVLNPILEPTSPHTPAPALAPAPAPAAIATVGATVTPAAAPATAPSGVYSPPAEVPQKTEQPEGK